MPATADPPSHAAALPETLVATTAGVAPGASPHFSVPSLSAWASAATPTTASSSGGVVPVGDLVDVLGLVPPRYWLSLGVVLVGVVLYVAVDRGTTRLFDRLGVRSVVEGTAFERTAREFDTSTVEIVAAVLAVFAFGMAVIVALSVAQVDFADPFWSAVAAYLPRLVVAVVVVIVGVVVGDKLDVLVSERLHEVKLPQVTLVPRLVKYSVIYVAVLVALAQLEVATLALVVLLAGYLLALIVFGGIASGALLASSAAGAYLLLNQPYAIGDEIRVDDVQGIVCEMDLFVTHVESDDEEYILPNRKVFRNGVVRVRG